MKTRIKKMIGKEYLFSGKPVMIKSIEPENEEEDLYLVKTEKKEMVMSEEEMLKDMMPVIDQEDEEKRMTLFDGFKQQNSQMSDLTDLLMENIKNVQEDESYINKAKSINDSVKNIIDIKKTQIDLYKATKDLM